jgi:hypothetical protein
MKLSHLLPSLLLVLLLSSITGSKLLAQGPSCTIISPVAPATSIFDSIPYTITFSRNVSGFVGTDIQLVNGILKHLTPAVGPASVYLAYVEPTDCGPVEMKIFAGAAQDSLGQQSTAAQKFVLRFDTCRPKIIFTPVNGNPTGTNPIPLHIDFSEPVTGFTAADVQLDSGTISGGITSYLGLDSLFTTAITPTGTSQIKIVVLHIDSGSVQDPVGLSNDSTAIVLTYNPVFTTVQSFQDHPSLRVYPSPGNGLMQVDFPFEALKNWWLVDLKGTEILKGEVLSGSLIDASSVPSGNYLLMLQGDSTHLVRKVIIQH